MISGFAFVLFLQGCVCDPNEEVNLLRKENLSLRDAVAKKNMESALIKKDGEMQIILVKKDAETQKLLITARIKELERAVSERDEKLKNSVSVDFLFQSSELYHYQYPTVLLDLWLKRNKPPKNASKAQLLEFVGKLMPITRSCSNSPVNQQKLVAAVSEQPETLLLEMINMEEGNCFSWIFSQLAQRMDKETLKRYLRYSKGKSAYWIFANQFWQQTDRTDKELIMKYFWSHNAARQKAVKFGFHKEILPEIKKRILDNFQQYQDLIPVIQPLFSAEEKEFLSKTIWESFQNERNRNLWSFIQHAPILLEMGYVPAFVQISLISPYINTNSNHGQINRIEKYTPVPFKDLQDWVLKNHGNIVFDRKTQKFTVATHSGGKNTGK